MGRIPEGDPVRIGKMVRLVGSPGIILPCAEPGNWRGGRLEMSNRRVGFGLVVEKRVMSYGETWFKVLFPEGVGWIQEGWGKEVK